MAKTYEVDGTRLIETESIERKREYTKENLEADIAALQVLLDEFNK